jgi:zinc transport system substrate-binding protein
MSTTTNHSKHIFILSLILLTGLIISLTACQTTNPQLSHAADALQVTVSILPQAYFVERIGGEAVEINVMVGPGEEAHTYEPSPEQMITLSDSVIFFTIGVEYEEIWVPRFKDINPDMTIIDSAQGIERHLTLETHTHGSEDLEEDIDDDDHAEQHFDPHVWLAPDNGKIIAENVLQALNESFPENSAVFNENFTRLMADIDALDAQIETTLTGNNRRKFMVFHPAWAYFADQYNLTQIPVQIGGQDPSAREMAELIQIAQEEQIQVIFVQPTFSTADAEAIAKEIGAQIAVIDPLARNWLENLETVANAFAAALNN